MDASEERDRLAARPLAQERSRLFDEQAEAYDRFRPTYPDAVIDELLGPVPIGLDVLDVGCGTGIASRQMAQRGAKVLGVELAPRMAEVARGHGVDVEIAAFEGWDGAGRTFDRVTLGAGLALARPPYRHRHGRFCAEAGRQALSDLETRGVSPMIWPMLSRRCTQAWCRPTATVCSGGTRPTGHPT